MNVARFNFAVTYDNNNNIYVFGGSCLEESEMYSVLHNDWKEIAPMKIKLELASACNLDNKFIYIIGGQWLYETSKII